MPLKLGDRNESVRQWRLVMNLRFGPLYTRLNGPLPTDTDEFGPRAAAWQREYERRTGQNPDGEVSDDDLRALKIALPANRPIVFSVEGHMSDMNVGPAVAIGQVLEAEGRCWNQPIAYNRTALPFDNESGIQELHRLFSGDRMDNGKPFPAGTPWQLHIFSQGGIVGSEFMMRHVLPEGADLHWRLKDWRGTVAYGNPYRERDVIAEWVPDPPRPGTQGISDRRMVNTPRDMWKEHSRHGDLYAENENNGVGEKKTAVYKMVQNEWFGALSITQQLLEVGLNPVPELIEVAQAVVSGVLFLTNMTPHGGYDITPCINWAREKLSQA